MSDGPVTITKFDAIQRQLDTAIELWFSDRDPVAIHTLLLASHEILHTLFRKKGLKHLLFDSANIKKEMRQEWNNQIRKCYNFFKHAQHDHDSYILFNQLLNEFVMIYSIQGIKGMKIPLTFFQEAFSQWFLINRTEFLADSLRAGVETMDISDLRALPKQEFLHDFHPAWKISQQLRGK
jgi:hypothetical protein